MNFNKCILLNPGHPTHVTMWSQLRHTRSSPRGCGDYGTGRIETDFTCRASLGPHSEFLRLRLLGPSEAARHLRLFARQ